MFKKKAWEKLKIISSKTFRIKTCVSCKSIGVISNVWKLRWACSLFYFTFFTFFLSFFFFCKLVVREVIAKTRPETNKKKKHEHRFGREKKINCRIMWLKCQVNAEIAFQTITQTIVMGLTMHKNISKTKKKKFVCPCDLNFNCLYTPDSIKISNYSIRTKTHSICMRMREKQKKNIWNKLM